MNFQSRLHRTWNHSCSAVPGNFFKCDTIFEISRRFRTTFVLVPYQKSRKKNFANFASIGPVIQKFWIQPEWAITLKVLVAPKTMTTVFHLKFDDSKILFSDSNQILKFGGSKVQKPWIFKVGCTEYKIAPALLHVHNQQLHYILVHNHQIHWIWTIL